MPSSFSSIVSRVLPTGLVAAGLLAALIGGAGAGAQDAAAPEATPIASPAILQAPAPAPTSTPAVVPGGEPVPVSPTATADPAPVVPAEAAPDAAPAGTPAPPAAPAPVAPASEPTPAPSATATPAASTPPVRKRRPKATERSTKGARCAPAAAVVTDYATAGLPGARATDLVNAFPTKRKPSTSDSACDSKRIASEEREADEKAEADAKKKRVVEEHVAVAPKPAPTTRGDGAPTPAAPGFALAQPGPARIGVPNFFIEKFRIPPFLLPIYQAAGIQYGIRWELLAAINEIETDYGRNLNVSSAGALGWMQFMPATWRAYGVDANKDGLKDPYNPVDAIFASARYLRAAGGEKDVRRAVFAYNHADWYVDSVLMRARLIGGLPVNFVGSLTGLTQGRFPVHAKATYAGSLASNGRGRRVKQGNAAYIVASDERRKSIDVFARRGSPVVAVNDGRVLAVGRSRRLGRFVTLQDVYGNTYTYGHLGAVAATYPSPKKRRVSRAQVSRELDLTRDPKPTRSASVRRTRREARPSTPRPAAVARRATGPAHPGATLSKERLFAHPSRPAARRAGGDAQLTSPDYVPAADEPIAFDPRRYVAKPLRKGVRVIGGTVLGRIGKGTETVASHLRFEIRPAGRGAPRVDPKPILDGWKLLESSAAYRAAGKNPFFGADAATPTIGQILLMGKEALERRVLENPRVEVYACGREDIRSGQVDRRVLATLEYLAASGLRPTVSSMRCGHGLMTASGNVSEHSTGDAVDIAAINGIPIIGHQGKGSITELAIQRLLALQGTMKPHQIISLMTFDGADNTFAMDDHADHIHVGWRPLYGSSTAAARRVGAILRPKQWIKLIDRLSDIDNPEVALEPSRYAVR